MTPEQEKTLEQLKELYTQIASQLVDLKLAKSDASILGRALTNEEVSIEDLEATTRTLRKLSEMGFKKVIL